MNDFTKDELYFIHSAMNIVKKSLPKEANFVLLDKLQSMIDNYCEHKEKAATSDEDGNMVVMCGRCDSVLWHEKD